MADFISNPPVRDIISDGKSNDQAWIGWFQTAFYILFSQTQSGTTAQRPTKTLWIGRRYFDTTLGKPIFFKGSGVWVDGAGTVS
jgi:hypothetical protein